MTADHELRVLPGPPALNRTQRRQAEQAKRNRQPTPIRPEMTKKSKKQASTSEKRTDTRPRPPKIDPAQYSLWLVAMSQLLGSAAQADALVQKIRRDGQLDSAARELSYTTALTFERARSLLQRALDCFPSNCSVN